jgi:excisionase family DNA binding protein
MQGNVDNYPEVLTLKELSEILRCSKTHICNLLHGRVPGVTRLDYVSVGRRKLVRRQWLKEWLEANRGQ